MSILLIAGHRNMTPFKQALLKKDPNLDIEIWPNVNNQKRITFAVAWNQPGSVFQAYPNLKVVSSLGAGVDHLLSDSSIPSHVKLTRVVAPSLADQMGDYVITGVYNILRKTHLYYKQQIKGVWQPLQPTFRKELTVGVMGLGALGTRVAVNLKNAGFRVNGWSRSKKEIEGIRSYSGKELSDFLQNSNIAVCLLPLTSKTTDILDLDLFKKLKNPSHIINAGRGEHLVDEDLVYALDAGLLESATLDVFREEPLPDSHPFWGRDNIILTPHIASLTDPDEVASLLAENYKRMLSGMELKYQVNRAREY